MREEAPILRRGVGDFPIRPVIGSAPKLIGRASMSLPGDPTLKPRPIHRGRRMHRSIHPALFLLCGLAVAATGQAADFSVSVPDAPGGRFAAPQFLDKMGCTGGNVSPRITWSNPPAGTRSFVVSVYDKDAMTGSGWWHWVVVNVPARATELPAGAGTDPKALPAGALQTNTDGGYPGYGGPCPPVGQTHDYVVTVKALKVDQLQLPPNATGAMVGMMSNLQSLGQATTIVRAGR
ncbi:YbhB/YbcL family Raf kinase inhibitor-like protein [Aquabacterium sp. J223]|uniref:YbhB/YbcL family Raf kinase inhibitor-like protein n=1 Tax=Aquabacterium sp. J223 TaxID=2898431 RepID=UPI0021AE051C|nr:YbhB/YbcL family Raf kinase inhibitor-like protein [Aquabacterium sp. J223]UUX94042.1 YbhB/YbcL family Raf kinase inhibitor-like protein [Aquabacterium sp. J223]